MCWQYLRFIYLQCPLAPHGVRYLYASSNPPWLLFPFADLSIIRLFVIPPRNVGWFYLVGLCSLACRLHVFECYLSLCLLTSPILSVKSCVLWFWSLFRFELVVRRLCYLWLHPDCFLLLIHIRRLWVPYHFLNVFLINQLPTDLIPVAFWTIYISWQLLRWH